MATMFNNATLRDIDLQVLTETVQGQFAQATAFMGSQLVTSGAVNIRDNMEVADPNYIGNEINMPYFGSLGEFVSNPEGSSVDTSQLAQTHEKAIVARDSMAFQISRWARYSGPDDPYLEAARQIQIAATRAMDKAIITQAMLSPLVSDVYNAGAPVYLTYDAVADARAMWGDEDRDGAVMLVHSRTSNDLRKMKDDVKRPLLVDSFKEDGVERFCGMPLVVSDRCPIVGSSMGTVTSAGTGTEPAMTITGTPLKPMKLRIKVDPASGTTLGSAKIAFSTDGGLSWSAYITTAAAATNFALIDTAKDSLVGVNGKTGLVVQFAGNFTDVDNTYASNSNMKASSLIVRRGALGYWYNRNALQLQTDKDIMNDSEVAAMHLYHAAKLYRRSPEFTTPGVIILQHNVSGFIG